MSIASAARAHDDRQLGIRSLRVLDRVLRAVAWQRVVDDHGVEAAAGQRLRERRRVGNVRELRIDALHAHRVLDQLSIDGIVVEMKDS